MYRHWIHWRFFSTIRRKARNNSQCQKGTIDDLLYHGDISPVFYRAVSRAAINFHAVLPLCSLPFTTHTRPIRPFSSATRFNYRLPGIEGTITRLMSCTRHKWANHTSTGSIHKSNRFPSESNSRLLLSRGTSIRRVCNRLYTRLGVEKLVEQTI